MPQVDPRKFQEARWRADLSQEALAERSQVSATTVSNIERGIFQPRGLTLYRLAKQLGVDPDALQVTEPVA